MKCGIVTLYDEGRKEFGDLTSTVAEKYATRHGYRFVRYRSLLDPTLPASWNKVLAMKDELTKGDEWTLWLDADALIVRPEVRLEEIIDATQSPGTDLLFSTDMSGLCAGVFFARNTQWVHEFFSTLLLLGEHPQSGHLYEQKSIMLLSDTFPAVRKKIGLISEDIILHPMRGFNAQAFIAHYWANSTDFHRVKTLAEGIIANGWQERYHFKRY